MSNKYALKTSTPYPRQRGTFHSALTMLRFLFPLPLRHSPDFAPALSRETFRGDITHYAQPIFAIVTLSPAPGRPRRPKHGVLGNARVEQCPGEASVRTPDSPRSGAEGESGVSCATRAFPPERSGGGNVLRNLTAPMNFPRSATNVHAVRLTLLLADFHII